MSEKWTDKLRNLVGEYWDIACQEGSEGRTTDTSGGAAQACWSKIDALLREREQNAGEAVAETPLKDAELLRTVCEDVPDMHPTVRAQLRRLAANIDAGAVVGRLRCRKCGNSEEVTIHGYTRPAQAVSVPDGWKLVPIEPTQEMLDNTVDANGVTRLMDFTKPEERSQPFLLPRAIYRALLASAPTAPAGDSRSDGNG